MKKVKKEGEGSNYVSHFIRVQLFRNILKLTKIKDEDLKSKTGGGVKLCRNIRKQLNLKINQR